MIEAYAAEPSRGTLQAVRDRTKEAGAGFELRVMASHGGTISIDAEQLGTTLISGPIGGVVGARWLAERTGLENVLCTDIGGTSFDIALMTEQMIDVTTTPDVARFVLNMPLVKLDSIGAGCRSFVRIDPGSGRPEIGPDSAGSRIGTAWPEGGVDTVSITDLNLLLGRLNADYFLGGQVTLDVERARHEVQRQIATPLGLPLERAAAGVTEIFESTLRNEGASRSLGKGYAPVDFTLLCYGGGGPLHVAGYTRRHCVSGRARPRTERPASRPSAARVRTLSTATTGRSTCRSCPALRRRDCRRGRDDHPGVGGARGPRVAEFAKSGFDADAVTFSHLVRMQYFGQLIDIEVVSPLARLDSADDVRRLTEAFEHAYQTTYAHAASSGELGYLVAQAIVKGSVPVEKPVLPSLAAHTGSPPVKFTRRVWWHDGFVTTDIYEMGDVRAGHTIHGPAVFEAESTTFPIPPGRTARLDEHAIFHLTTTEA